MKTLKLTTLLLGLALVFSTSCKKYEEGPAISLRSKKARLVNTWVQYKSIDEEGVEETYPEDNTTSWELKKDGTLISSYPGDPDETGKWYLTKDGGNLVIESGEFGFAFVQEIILLKNKEFALKEDDGYKTYFKQK